MLYLPTCSLHFSKNQPNVVVVVVVRCIGKNRSKYTAIHGSDPYVGYICTYIYIHICISYPFPRCLQRSHPVVKIDEFLPFAAGLCADDAAKGHGGPSS